MLNFSIYLSLFLSAFIAATLMPTASEAYLVGLILMDQYPVGGLILVASVGNVLGSMVNYLLGRFFIYQRLHTVKHNSPFIRAQAFYHSYGKWCLLFSWLPIIGDPLTLVAGIMRESFWTFMLLVTIAKVGRYVVLTALTLLY